MNNYNSVYWNNMYKDLFRIQLFEEVTEL